MKKVLVTGIGGVVGQGIIKNILRLKRDIEIIGTNTRFLSTGNYLCAKVYEVLPAVNPEYINQIQKIVEDERIDLIIPSTDYEVYYLGQFAGQIGCPVACNEEGISSFCLDKYLNGQRFKEVGLPFAASFLPTDKDCPVENIIVKPREGRGSRNIFINPPNLLSFDSSYVVQELLSGEEITSTGYVLKSGELLGTITFKRELDNGNTTFCEVIDEYDSEIENLFLSILKHYPFRGSFNIQSIVHKGKIVPFEINCRISGTNSVRSHFGFEDVKYTLQEHLFDEKPEKPMMKKGAALRVIEDLIFPDAKLQDLTNNSVHFFKG